MIRSFKIYERWLDDMPILIQAIKSNKSYSNIKKLIEYGNDVNSKDYLDWTPLLWATYSKNTKLIKLLIDSGADMNHKALHSIARTKKMVDFYDLAVDKEYYEGGYKKIVEWIKNNYPHFVNAKEYNL